MSTPTRIAIAAAVSSLLAHAPRAAAQPSPAISAADCPISIYLEAGGELRAALTPRLAAAGVSVTRGGTCVPALYVAAEQRDDAVSLWARDAYNRVSERVVLTVDEAVMLIVSWTIGDVQDALLPQPAPAPPPSTADAGFALEPPASVAAEPSIAVGPEPAPAARLDVMFGIEAATSTGAAVGSGRLSVARPVWDVYRAGVSVLVSLGGDVGYESTVDERAREGLDVLATFERRWELGPLDAFTGAALGAGWATHFVEYDWQSPTNVRSARVTSFGPRARLTAALSYPVLGDLAVDAGVFAGAAHATRNGDMTSRSYLVPPGFHFTAGGYVGLRYGGP